jgi:hypothetical protein
MLDEGAAKVMKDSKRQMKLANLVSTSQKLNAIQTKVNAFCINNNNLIEV